MPEIKDPTGEEIKAALDPYMYGVGSVTYMWCRLVETMGLLFIHVTGMQFHAAQATWYSLDSDRSQLKLLQAALKATPAGKWAAFPNAKADLEWLVERTINLANARNDVVHAPAILIMGDEGLFVRADPTSGHQRAKNLKDYDLEPWFKYCRDRCGLLEGFAHATMAALQFGPGIAWPDKPSLPPQPDQKVPIK
jgi:hypothetical protein